MKRNLDFSYVSNAENQYIDSLYEQFRESPESVDESWKRFFEGFEYAASTGHLEQTDELAQTGQSGDDMRVYRLIHAYRDRGHLKARTNPIRERRDRSPGLDYKNFGFKSEDLEKKYPISKVIGLENATLQDIINRLETIYCGSEGIEYCHIKSAEIRDWIKENWELSLDVTNRDTFNHSLEKRTRILQKLNQASVLENFLHTKYVGQKRFSLEGGECAIPAVDAMINEAGEHGVEEVVIGMAHRGRLNILANIMQKTYTELFSEFEGNKIPEREGDGDVKYHLGFRSYHKTPQEKKISLHLMPNPSHLETVAPVVSGYVRAKGDAFYEDNYSKILPIIIHGDAAIAGQGVVYEMAQMSKLSAYQTHGTIHFVINNQIGFTTDFWEGRSSHYCTQVAHVSDSPTIHVNGDDADAVVHAVEFAVKFRQKFKQDIYIDMVCYRKYGHNEGDEPKFTQPKLYKAISKHPDPRSLYSQELIERGDVLAEMAKSLESEFKQMLQKSLDDVKEEKAVEYKRAEPDADWSNMRYSKPEDFDVSPKTSVSEEELKKVHQALSHIPQDLKPIKKVTRIVADREKAWKENKFDWALGELFAYGTLLRQGHDVRISGQDVLRGTFSHRHASQVDEEKEIRHIPLCHVGDKQGKFQAYNSLLSEYAVLGFEYGYSFCHPNNLTLWEAQFGDFSNGAQIVIDQFLSSAESKWDRGSGLTMLLPHGYEGQGPEHSSARPERYLQLCAEFNMIVAYCTKPANFFHLLRRQLAFPFRKPLVVFTPKSLLRHPGCVSSLDEFTKGKFEEFFDDEDVDVGKVKRVLFCTGKIYYDLLERKQKDKRKDIALVRLEQLHPIPFERFDKAMEKYKGAEFIWIQEEPKNMGFWNYILRKLDYYNLGVISRKSSASPATGYGSVHAKEQEELMEQAFKI